MLNLPYHGGIIGLVIFILDIWAIVIVLKTNTDVLNKILWIFLILVLPVIGLVLWYLLGPGRKTA